MSLFDLHFGGKGVACHDPEIYGAKKVLVLGSYLIAARSYFSAFLFVLNLIVSQLVTVSTKLS